MASKRKRSFTEVDIREIVEKKNHIFISFRRQKTQHGSKTYVVSECPKGHRLEVRLDGFENRECRECAKETRSKKQSLNEDYVKNSLMEHGYSLLSPYKNSQSHITVECPEGHIRKIKYGSFRDGHRCLTCFNIRQTGSNSVSWNGGFRNLNEYVRKKINVWKYDSIKNSNYKCVITGEKFDVIHHLIGFNFILSESMNELNYPVYDQISLYSNDELLTIIDKVLEVHYRYPLGVCLTKEIHDEFHGIYGKGNNTPEQFIEFKEIYMKKKVGVAV